MTTTRQKALEERAINQVSERLRSRFSDRSRADVDSVVQTTARRFATARIRDFIPLLVERMSRDELNHRFTA